LLAQAEREVMQRELEYSRLATAVARLQSALFVIRQTHKPSPFGFPLMVSRLREKLTSEKLADRVARMQLEFDKAAPLERSSQATLGFA
jgi:ATP-dependent Lhr-like helicase